MKKSLKRIAALSGVVILIGLAVTTLLVAIFLPAQPQLLAGLVVAMIGLPILLWLGLYVARKVLEAKAETKKKTG